MLSVNNMTADSFRMQVNIVCQNPKCTHYLKEKDKHITKKANTTQPTTKDTNANTAKHTSYKPKARPSIENI
jgi:hypothetical protein